MSLELFKRFFVDTFLFTVKDFFLSKVDEVFDLYVLFFMSVSSYSQKKSLKINSKKLPLRKPLSRNDKVIMALFQKLHVKPFQFLMKSLVWKIIDTDDMERSLKFFPVYNILGQSIKLTPRQRKTLCPDGNILLDEFMTVIIKSIPIVDHHSIGVNSFTIQSMDDLRKVNFFALDNDTVFFYKLTNRQQLFTRTIAAVGKEVFFSDLSLNKNYIPDGTFAKKLYKLNE